MHLHKQSTPSNSLVRSRHNLHRCYLMHFFFSSQAIILYSFPLLKSFTLHILSDPNPHLQSDSSPKFKQGTKRYFTAKKRRGGEKSMNQKARKWNSLYKRRGNFNVRWGTVELCSVLAGCGVKRAAATAGYIYSDKSSHTLKSPSKVCLFKRQ